MGGRGERKGINHILLHFLHQTQWLLSVLTLAFVQLLFQSRLVPRPRPAFHRLQYRKAVRVQGEPRNEANSSVRLRMV